MKFYEGIPLKAMALSVCPLARPIYTRTIYTKSCINNCNFCAIDLPKPIAYCSSELAYMFVPRGRTRFGGGTSGTRTCSAGLNRLQESRSTSPALFAVCRKNPPEVLVWQSPPHLCLLVLILTRWEFFQFPLF